MTKKSKHKNAKPEKKKKKRMESQAGTSILVLSLILPHDLKIVTSFILLFLQL